MLFIYLTPLIVSTYLNIYAYKVINMNVPLSTVYSNIEIAKKSGFWMRQKYSFYFTIGRKLFIHIDVYTMKIKLCHSEEGLSFAWEDVGVVELLEIFARNLVGSVQVIRHFYEFLMSLMCTWLSSGSEIMIIMELKWQNWWYFGMLAWIETLTGVWLPGHTLIVSY